jgi:hypothetical protein
MLEDHRLLHAQIVHSKDTFPRYVGPNASGKPQPTAPPINSASLPQTKVPKAGPPAMSQTKPLNPYSAKRYLT